MELEAAHRALTARLRPASNQIGHEQSAMTVSRFGDSRHLQPIDAHTAGAALAPALRFIENRTDDQSSTRSLVTRVAQLPCETRVAPQAKAVLTYSVSVQVWAMYSLAIQMSLPSTAAAP
jgi:hypothetical protein